MNFLFPEKQNVLKLLYNKLFPTEEDKPDNISLKQLAKLPGIVHAQYHDLFDKKVWVFARVSFLYFIF